MRKVLGKLLRSLQKADIKHMKGVGAMDSSLPNEYEALLKSPDVVLPGEAEALARILTWMNAPLAAAGSYAPESVLLADRFAWLSIEEAASTTTAA